MEQYLFALLNKLESFVLDDTHSRVKLTTHDSGSFTIRIFCKLTRDTVISYDSFKQVANISFISVNGDESIEIHNPKVINHIRQLKERLQKELQKKDFITTDGFFKILETKLNNPL